jgi:Methyltransferase domain
MFMIEILFLGGILMMLLWNFHKTRRVHLMLYHAIAEMRGYIDKAFGQAEALTGLYLELKLNKCLPRTRGWAASPDFLLEIALHILKATPHIVVECGSGVSSVVIGRCLQLNGRGRLYSMEHDAEFAKSTRKEIEMHGLAAYATVLDCPLQPQELNGTKRLWYSTDSFPNSGIDMLVVDGPPDHIEKLARYPTGALLFPRLTSGAVVFVDDLNRTDERKTFEIWSKEFPDFVPEIKDLEKGCGILRVPR